MSIFTSSFSNFDSRDANEGQRSNSTLLTSSAMHQIYDKYEHLTTEYQVKGEFADYGIE